MNLTHSLYTAYRYGLFPYVKDRRGATRIKKSLHSATLQDAEPYTGTPQTIFEAGDWDTCIILDACRHDLYEAVNGPTPKRVTVGSSSREYIEQTYTEPFPDVVQITANPHFHSSRFSTITGRSVSETFRDVRHLYLDKWNEEERTVLPSAVVDAAIDASETYPDSRLVVHFMQPHFPFVNHQFGRGLGEKTGERHVWQLCELGKLSRETVWRAYRENLEYVMPYVDRLVDQLDGTTVVTADHGNLVGECGRYGHPDGCEAKVLREVPWDYA